jgi:threonine dehydrogenase-like Zn-dependent dehydrogenase
LGLPGDTVAVYGAGVVGQFAIASAFRQGASRVFAIDGIETRLVQALDQNADVIDFNKEDPTEVLMDATLGIGVDAVIDAVGVDAQRPSSGPAAAKSKQKAEQFAGEVAEVAPKTNVQGENWVPGNAPSQVSQWSVETVRKYGRIGIIGVYSPAMTSYPIGQAMNKNLTIRAGNCDHRSVTPPLLDLVASGVFDPTRFITQHEPITDVVEAYLNFDRREEGWLKTVLTTA